MLTYVGSHLQRVVVERIEMCEQFLDVLNVMQMLCEGSPIVNSSIFNPFDELRFFHQCPILFKYLIVEFVDDHVRMEVLVIPMFFTLSETREAVDERSLIFHSCLLYTSLLSYLLSSEYLSFTPLIWSSSGLAYNGGSVFGSLKISLL